MANRRLVEMTPQEIDEVFHEALLGILPGEGKVFRDAILGVLPDRKPLGPGLTQFFKEISDGD